MSRIVKCLVWDLDETLWRGVLVEDREVTLRDGVAEIVAKLDARGILQSVASKNDEALARAKLRSLGLDEYFLHPQIHWAPKSTSIRAIAEQLNLGIDAFAFIDDDPFERAEVSFGAPEVLCLDATDVGELLTRPEFVPRHVTDESPIRRAMYRAEEERKRDEASFQGPPEAFLRTLGMELRIARATELDLRRAEELTIRTNQLNTTGRPYSYEQLRAMLEDRERYLVLIAKLTDRFGPYGTIGLTVLERAAAVWAIRLYLMSCRVMSRGIGTSMLTVLLQRCRADGHRLEADFVETDRNRAMWMTYRFAGFRTKHRSADGIILEHPLVDVPRLPDYVRFEIDV